MNDRQDRLMDDIAKMAAQVPALFEALSGMQMSELFSKVRTIGDKAPVPPTLEGGGNGGADKKAKAAGA